MKRIALPFLVLSDETVELDNWTIGEPGQPKFPLTEILHDWDYEMDLEVEVDLTVDFKQAAADLRLEEKELRLTAVLVTGTGAGTMPRRQDRGCTVMLDNSRATTRLSAILPGHLLSAQIHLDVSVLFEGPTESGGLLSPKQRGSRLWQDLRHVLLEDGGDSRFPIELTSFTDSFQGKPEQYAPWYTHWDPANFHADFGGSVRLYVNSDIEDVAKRFVEGDRILLQAIVSDVMSQMISTALDLERDDEFLSDFEEGSIGHQTRVWIETAFRGQSPESIRALRMQSPGRFQASILAAAELRSEE